MENKKPKFKRSYFIFLGISLLAFCLAVTLPDYKITIEKIENKFLNFVSAQTSYTQSDDFNITFEFSENRLSYKCLNISIQNLKNEVVDVPIKTILNETNFDVTELSNMQFFEYIESEPFLVNDTNTTCYPYNISANYTDENNDTIYYNQTIDNCTTIVIGNHTETSWSWETKNLINEDNEGEIELTNQWEEITLLKPGNEEGKDTKNFRLCFNTPLISTGHGWGSAGTFYLNLSGDLFWDKTHSSWWNSTWTYKKNITINHSKVNQTQTNFPVLINLTDTDLITKAQADGDDIAFTNSTGSQLDHEIEYFNSTTGFLVAWVRIPTLSNTTDTVIQMYYGNADAVNQENASGVWDSNFVMVQHLSETPTAYMNDSTSNNNDGTTYNMTSADQVAGQIDGSLDFDGTADYVNFGDVPATEGISALTVSVWVKATTWNVGNGNWPNIVGKRVPGGEGPFYMRVRASDDASANKIEFGIRNSAHVIRDAITNNVLDTTNYYHLAGTWDGTTVKFFVNTVEQTDTGSVSGVTDSTAEQLHIGRARASENELFNGIIDEVRISNTARSAGWIATEYNNQYSPSSFYSVGSEETDGDTTSPTYSNNAHNTTLAGNSINFSIDWNDNSALHPNGQYIFSTNNTGIWVNESAVNFTSTPQSVSVVKTLNSTVGLSVGYRWYGTDNVGNTNETGVLSFVTTSAPADTCSCPGLASNWEISLADYCNITSNCNLSTGNITFINNGSVLFNATLTANKISWKDSIGVVEKYNLGNLFKGWIG